MSALTDKRRRRLSFAVLAVLIVAIVGAAVARSADGPTPFAELDAKLADLSTQLTQVNGSTDELGSQLAALDAKVTQLDAKVTQLDSKVRQPTATPSTSSPMSSC
jgi:septal ring factor EnvC (AmiA/AmiB activator)